MICPNQSENFIASANLHHAVIARLAFRQVVAIYFFILFGLLRRIGDSPRNDENCRFTLDSYSICVSVIAIEVMAVVLCVILARNERDRT